MTTKVPVLAGMRGLGRRPCVGWWVPGFAGEHL